MRKKMADISTDYNELMNTIMGKYPNFRTWRIVFSGPTGSGKSVAAASFPTPEDKQRTVFDFEDSMAYIDATETGVDIYTPRKQRFRMKRYIYPTLHDIGEVYQKIKTGTSDISVCVFDNVAIFQDNIVSGLQANATNVAFVRELFKSFGAASALPFDSQIQKWGYQKDPTFWNSAKAIPKAFIMEAMKQGVHLVATSEEANVWTDYGTSKAKVIGQKAKIWDVWMRYFDMVVFLDRDVNKTDPPHGSVNPLQPKQRLQGLNPKWVMDWPGFIAELKVSMTREEPEIPDSAKVNILELHEESDTGS
jgi:hypothetical protein